MTIQQTAYLGSPSLLNSTTEHEDAASDAQKEMIAGHRERDEANVLHFQAIDVFVDRVLRCCSVPFDPAKGPYVQDHLYIPRPIAMTPAFREQYDLGESVRIFIEVADELGLSAEWPLREPLEPCRARANTLVWVWANEFVCTLRRRALVAAAQRRAVLKRCYAKLNFRNGKALIEALFAKCSRLNVVRVDLEYLERHPASLEQAKADFSRLLNNSRQNAIFAHMLGYIWRLEWARETGFHFHVIFFFDDSERNQSFYIGQQIAEYWDNVITKGRGRTHICKIGEYPPDRLGIGTIDRRDIRKRSVLVNVVLHYLVKADELACPRVPKGTRTFQTSQMPEPHSGLGRPRSMYSGGVTGQAS
jgi:hypothetical protein